MAIDKNIISGSTTMLILSLLSEQDMYGYQMISIVNKRTNNCFEMKNGTLYPLLHNLEEQGMIVSYESESDSGRVRKFYRITPLGKTVLKEKKIEWRTFITSINYVMGGLE